ncbi:Uncharacterised protein [Yersinia rohdei]|uniref:hypothetical protein n=1 Tax=Yersinia rohdei TaxID=29485 RepID=UPI0005DEF908|nr:hypothetical protein [Yersinia rohdei]CNJ37230.1 Uncharacterised protein [Yersinia rohdei]
MSDNNEKVVDFDSFASYLQTLDGDQVCPACNQEKWTLFTPMKVPATPDDDRLVIPTLPGSILNTENAKSTGGLFRGASFDVLVMQCVNCGFVNLFNYLKVKDNIDNGVYIQKKEGGENDNSAK